MRRAIELEAHVIVNVGPNPREGFWFSDGYGDYIRHFMAGLGSVPEWGAGRRKPPSPLKLGDSSRRGQHGIGVVFDVRRRRRRHASARRAGAEHQSRRRPRRARRSRRHRRPALQPTRRQERRRRGHVVPLRGPFGGRRRQLALTPGQPSRYRADTRPVALYEPTASSRARSSMLRLSGE